MNMRLSEKIAFNLEKAILKGEFPVGSRFPPERELVEQYGVSRSTIREAVGKLAQLGLVETLPQSGTYVSDYHSEASLDLLLHIMQNSDRVDTEIVFSLMEFRRVFELYAVRKAVTTASEEDLVTLQSIVDIEMSNKDNPQEIAHCDYTFHYKIISLAHNIVLQLMFNSFKPVYRYYTSLFFTLPETIVVTIEQHRRLCQAFRARDISLAVQVMEEALRYGEDCITKELEAIGTRTQ